MSANIQIKMTSEEAESLLKRRLGSRVIGLRVRIHEVGITLQGTAYSYHVKQLAQHAAMSLLGLPIVANEIEVRMNLRPLDADGLDLA
jgi:osmotically-inducible protein OsmY